ncbi:hypothetical protein LCGC14_1239460 [marine sediment metagenome]|uniref:SpoVT-AbrB domain-containing protein n=1 Tax=marine sediment metagenome TaxID=412755 RepID=A0A0F9LTG3_9ZZZZ
MHQRQITKIGNSLGVTVPADYLHRLGWMRGDLLHISLASNDRILIQKVPNPRNKTVSR